MKTMKLIKNTVVLLWASAVLGCVSDNEFETPNIQCNEPNLKVTNSISQVKEMYTFGGPKVIENDIIIEGYVVSSDKSGNIYKSISIQDKPENPTSAIKISIDQTNLYTKFNVGRKVYVKLKGLAVGYSFGSVQIGTAVQGELGRISAFEVDKYIIRSCEEAIVIPKKVAISQLNDSMLEMLIELENVQFKTTDLGQSYGNVTNTATVNRLVESFDTNCSLIGEVAIRNSGYATFKNELLPNGKGNIVAVFSNYYDDFQLYIRTTEDVKLTKERCNYDEVLKPTITLDAIKNMYQGTMVEFGVQTNYIVEGYVISSDESKNFEKKLVIQDKTENPTAGIQLLIDNEAIFENYKVGDKVFIRLNKLYMTKNEGVLTIGYPKGTKVVAIEKSAIGSYIYNSGENKEIIPKEIGIGEILNEKFQNTLVKVVNVQLNSAEIGKAFAFFSGTENGIRTIETCNETIKLGVFTNGKASFSNQQFPIGRGSISGVLNANLEMRTINDIQFNNTYEVCEVPKPKIMITEVADPINNVSARFVELYNAGETVVKLTGWKLNKYLNGANTVSSGSIDLSNITMAAGGFAIIGSTEFNAVFKLIAAIESSYISGNGDDVYELVDNTGKRIDIFGVVGEDGNGTNWEYLDGRAFRNLDVLKPNPTFTISEWTVFSDATNSLINYQNAPKNAPNDYNPNLR